MGKVVCGICDEHKPLWTVEFDQEKYRICVECADRIKSIITGVGAAERALDFYGEANQKIAEKAIRECQNKMMR